MTPSPPASRAAAASTSPVRWTFPRQVLFVTFVVLLLLLAWRLVDLFVLAFGAVIVATVLRVLADALERYAKVPARLSLMTGLLLIVGLLGLGGYLVGDPLAAQFKVLREQVPAAFASVMNWLNSHRLGEVLLGYWDEAKGAGSPPIARLAGYAGLTFGAIGSAGLMVVMGIYLAASPRLYRDGVLRLVPQALRPRFAGALDASGRGLSRWLLGQSVSMLFVGASTAMGLWILDVPLAFSVGVISGLMAFIPFFGAIAGGLLAVLLAFMQGPETALYVVILAVAIQQVEGHVLMPFVQRWAVDLPPVLGIAAAVMFGVLFGLMGVLLATPLMVVLIILVQKLYVEAVLDEEHAKATG